MKQILLSLGVFASLFSSSPALAEFGDNAFGGHTARDTSTRWNEDNDPFSLDSTYNSTFDQLPLKASVSRLPWTGWYWPAQRGGINARWQLGITRNPDYTPYSFYELRMMSVDQIAVLSPAEKYDIYLSRYDYPLVKRVQGQRPLFARYWNGICNGAAPASIHTKEPQPVTLVNADGIAIPFGSADIKALLSYFYAYDSETLRSIRFVGAKCRFYNINDPSCNDINPGSFHIIVANQIGLKDQSFVSEMDKGREIWNHAVRGYETRILQDNGPIPSNAAPGTVRRVKVATHLLAVDSIEPEWKPLAGTEKEIPMKQDEYTYWLDLNAQGQIIGGDWERSDHPDFFWIQQPAEMIGPWAGLKRIYEASISTQK